jgi:uncharacterized protein (DUF433 family)
MNNNTPRSERIRVQLDLTPVEVSLLELLQHRLAVRSRADLLQQAFGAFLWIVDEMLSGRRIVSVDAQTLEQIPRFKELSLPAVAPATFNHYEHLVQRPEKGRQQPYLKGRNMTVGQLIYTMRANNLSVEEAAADMDLPVMQVREAAAYYQVHRELVDGEAAEEGRQLRAMGVELEPRAVPR